MIPIGTDRPARRRPIVNESIIALNVIVYIGGLAGTYFGLFQRESVANWGHYDPENIRLWQLLTYQFIHDPYGLGHLFFNMLFLWVFGNSVEDRLGRVGYIGFYLIGGIAAGIAHGIVSNAPVIGASGAIAGVSGAFLALFPRSRVRVLWLFFIIGIIQIPALWFIGLYFALDLVNQTMNLFGRGGSQVAYGAHLAGYIYGFGVGFCLLAFGVLKHEEFDIFFLFKQANRRRQFRSVVDKQPGVWDSPNKADDAKDVKARQQNQELSAEEVDLARSRSEIAHHAASGLMEKAAERYRELAQRHDDLTMNERLQADLANHFYQEGDFASAAMAYDRLIRMYPSTAQAPQYRLLLGLIFARHEEKPERAVELIQRAYPALRNDGEIALAKELLDELNAPLTPNAEREE